MHRDVKPGNVLLRRDGVTKLVDLGIATAAGPHPHHAQRHGARHRRLHGARAARGRATPDPRPTSTRWPWCCFEALTGERARQGRTPMEIAHRIATGPPPDLRDAHAERLAAGRRGPEAAHGARRRATARPRPASWRPAWRARSRSRHRAHPRRAAHADRAQAGPDPGAGPAAAKPPPHGARTPRRRTAGSARPAPSRSRSSSSRSRRPACSPLCCHRGGDDGGQQQQAQGGGQQQADGGRQQRDGQQEQQPQAEEQQPRSRAAEPRRPSRAAGACAAAERSRLRRRGERRPAERAGLRADAAGRLRGRRADPAGGGGVWPEDSRDINYAYALFNLGKSLNRSGRPDEAIPYLEKRLTWDDQRETVQAELDLARRNRARIEAETASKPGGVARLELIPTDEEREIRAAVRGICDSFPRTTRAASTPRASRPPSCGTRSPTRAIWRDPDPRRGRASRWSTAQRHVVGRAPRPDRARLARDDPELRGRALARACRRATDALGAASATNLVGTPASAPMSPPFISKQVDRDAVQDVDERLAVHVRPQLAAVDRPLDELLEDARGSASTARSDYLGEQLRAPRSRRPARAASIRGRAEASRRSRWSVTTASRSPARLPVSRRRRRRAQLLRAPPRPGRSWCPSAGRWSSCPRPRAPRPPRS